MGGEMKACLYSYNTFKKWFLQLNMQGPIIAPFFIFGFIYFSYSFAFYSYIFFYKEDCKPSWFNTNQWLSSAQGNL